MIKKGDPLISRRLKRALPVLFLSLGFFLFLGWRVADLSPEESAPSWFNTGRGSAGVGQDDGKKVERSSWAEKTDRWSRILKESGTVLSGDDTPEQRIARGPERQGNQMGFVSLDDSINAGDMVQVVWNSADGSVWKKMFDHPFRVQDFSHGVAVVSITPEEARVIASEKAKGQVFAAPR